MGPATNAQISSMRGVAVERVQRSSGACHGDDLVDLQSSSTTQVAVIHRHRLHLSSQSHGQEAVINHSPRSTCQLGKNTGNKERQHYTSRVTAPGLVLSEPGHNGRLYISRRSSSGRLYITEMKRVHLTTNYPVATRASGLASRLKYWLASYRPRLGQPL